MEIITQEGLYTLLEEYHAEIELISKGGDLISVSPVLYFNSSEEPSFKGYSTELQGNFHRSRKYETLITYLKKLGAEQEGTYHLFDIEQTFPTISDYEEQLAFDRIDMKGLIEKYGEIADSFELVCPFDNDQFLSESDGDAVFREVSEYEWQHLQMLRIDAKRENKGIAPLSSYVKRVQEIIDGNPEEHEFALFDYAETLPPAVAELVYAIYNREILLRELSEDLSALARNVKKLPIEIELSQEELSPLKPFLLSVRLSCVWHCTTSGQLHKIFRFRLTEETKRWLLRFPTDYDLQPLEDLAFYRGEKILFSSCTHEEFHIDLSQD